jgi:fluoride exporter
MNTVVVASSFLLVAAGATVVRAVADRANHPGSLPWGTLAVNLAGSFVAGLAVGWLGDAGDSAGALLVSLAFLGSLTTFSGFARELAGMADDGAWRLATTNLMLGVVGGVGAALLGLTLSGG